MCTEAESHSCLGSKPNGIIDESEFFLQDEYSITVE